MLCSLDSLNLSPGSALGKGILLKGLHAFLSFKECLKQFKHEITKTHYLE